MKIRLIIFSALFLICLSAGGQDNSRLTGTVSNDRQEPLAGASVKVLNTSFSTSTGKDGSFLIENIAPGEYTLRIVAPGYANVTKLVSLPAGGLLDIRLTPSAEQLGAVTVTAQKREEDPQQVPFSISTITSEKVAEYNLWNSKDLAAIVPNLYAANPGDNRNVISLRGITTTSYDPAVATYIDGVNQFGLDTYIAQLLDIERIEVLRGPQGTLYGRNAMGGVINIITRQPGNTTSGYVSAGIGNYGQQRYGLGFRTPLVRNKLFLGVAGMYDSQDGFYTNTFNDSDYDRANSFMGNYYLKYLASPEWALTLNVKHDQNRNHGAFPLVADPGLALEQPFELSQNALTKLVDNVFNASFSANHYGKGFNFSSQTSWQSNYRYYTEPIDGDFSPADVVSIVNNYGRDWNNVRVATQEFRFSSTESSASALRWTAGIYGFYQDNPVKQGTHLGDDSEDFPNSTSIVVNEGKGFGLALYGQASYRLTSGLELTAGIRYDHEQKELGVRQEFQPDGTPPMVIQSDTSGKADFNALSPKVSLSYDLSDLHHMYLTYSRGFRAGGITQLSADPSEPLPLYPYDPEYSNNFEAGIKNLFAEGRVRLNFAAFYTKVTGAQVPTLILPEAITVTRNAGELESKGLELELAATPARGLELTVNTGYTDARYTDLKVPENGEVVSLDGNRQVFTPEMTSMLAAQYTWDLGGRQHIQLKARGEWHYIGTQYFDLANQIKQKGYSLVNARAGIAARNIELFFWARNILDQTYIDYAYDFGATHLGAPGTFGISVMAKM